MQKLYPSIWSGKQIWVYGKPCWYNQIIFWSLTHSFTNLFTLWDLLSVTKHQKYKSCLLYWKVGHNMASSSDITEHDELKVHFRSWWSGSHHCIQSSKLNWENDQQNVWNHDSFWPSGRVFSVGVPSPTHAPLSTTALKDFVFSNKGIINGLVDPG